jgi:hypothetical protein
MGNSMRKSEFHVQGSNRCLQGHGIGRIKLGFRTTMVVEAKNFEFGHF